MSADLSYKNDEDQDNRLNPAELGNLEHKTGDDQFNNIVNNYDKTADDSQENANIEKARTGEENASIPQWSTSVNGNSGDKTSVRFLGARKKSASLFITIGLLGGGLGASFFSFPGLLLVQMKEVFTNYGSSASRAAPARYNKMLKYTIGSPDAAKACEKPTSKKCKLGTMSEEQKANYEKEGFKVNGEAVDGRTRVTSVEFPDGKKVTNGSDFTKYTKKNPAAASAAGRAHNPATKVYNGGRFASVLKKLGLDRSKEDVSGKNDDERKKDFNKRTGNDITPEERSSKFKEKYSARISSSGAIKKSGALSGVAALGCAGYNIAKITVAAVKVENGLRFAAFALQFLKAADQIKNRGDISPETTSFLGTVLTSTAATGAKAGLAATDSQGYKIAAYGGEGLLRDWTAAFLLGGNPVLITIDNTVQYINKEFGGRSNVRTVCRAASNIYVGTGITAAICGGETVAAAGGATLILPGVGTVGAGVAAGATCLASQAIIMLAIMLAAPRLTEWMVSNVLPLVTNMLSNTDLDTNKISGVDAGNGIAVGAGVMLGTTALSRGLKPGSKSDVTTFLAATADDQAQTDKIAMYDAQNEPFNIYNQYSFLGSAVRKSGIALRAPSSISEGLSSLGSIISSSIKLIPTAGASPASMPVNITTADLSDCPDLDMKDIGIDCDKMGQPQFVLSPTELNMEVSDNLDYMIPKFVTEDGTEVPDTTYTKWLANCTEQREAPMGATFSPLEDPDYNWSTGEYCISGDGSDGSATQENLSNFRVYYNTLAEKEDGDTAPPATTSESGSSFTLMSYNIKTSDQTDMQDGTGGDGYPIDSIRYKNAAKIITDSGASVVGLQEIGNADRTLLNDNLTGYTSFPTSPSDSSNHASLLPIYWKTDSFSLVDGGNIAYPWSVCSGLTSCSNATWVRLHNISSGDEFYVTNIHMTNVRRGTGGSGDGADQREKSAQILNDFAANKNVPVLSVGDFNSSWGLSHDDSSLKGDRSRIPYCVMTDTAFSNAFDIFNNKTGKCPTQASDQPYQIDHIYASKKSDIGVDEYKVIKNDLTKITSDHNPVLANIVMGGTSSGIVAATYNLLNIDGHPGDSIAVAGAACNKSVDTNCINTRTKYQSEIILGKSGDNPQFDILGTQETSPDQYRLLKSLLPGYDSIPSTGADISRLSSQQNGATSVFWNTSKLTKVDEGKVNLVSNVANVDNRGNITAPWVALQSGSEKIYVLSIHFPNSNFVDPKLGDDGTLSKATDLTLKWVNEKKVDGKVIVMGDFNDHTNEHGSSGSVTYCGLTANAVMQNTYDMAKHASISKQCPNPTPDFGIDHIYITPGANVAASKWKHLSKSSGSAAVVHGSDHTPVYSILTIGGNG